MSATPPCAVAPDTAALRGADTVLDMHHLNRATGHVAEGGPHESLAPGLTFLYGRLANVLTTLSVAWASVFSSLPRS